MERKVSVELGGKTLSIQTGKVAKQALREDIRRRLAEETA